MLITVEPLKNHNMILYSVDSLERADCSRGNGFLIGKQEVNHFEWLTYFNLWEIRTIALLDHHCTKPPKIQRYLV